MSRSARRSIGSCVRRRAERSRWLALLAIAVGLAACEQAAPFDPEAAARTILGECKGDSSCIRERWRRDPRDWGLGLRAEIGGANPRTPLVVETTREIASPDHGSGACAAASAGANVDYRTSVTHRGSDQFAFALFRWESYEQALIGHREVVALVSRSRGDEEALWKALTASPSADRACLRFRGRRDRCADPS